MLKRYNDVVPISVPAVDTGPSFFWYQVMWTPPEPPVNVVGVEAEIPSGGLQLLFLPL